MTIQEAFLTAKKRLQNLYDEGEALAIAELFIEYITGFQRIERILNKEQMLPSEKITAWKEDLDALEKGMPLQYITGEQWFLGEKFYVNKHVLIPRQETEELVQWIVADNAKKNTISILDIGTGSGCIAVSLKKLLPQAHIAAMDVSSKAIETAQKNAAALQAEVDFLNIDFLNSLQRNTLGQYDIIVSNPPYIPFDEKNKLAKNVKDFEPAEALFVPDKRPLVFYEEIIHFSKNHLAPQGVVYCELHKTHAYETEKLFNAFFTQVELRKDMNGNERMLKASGEDII